jgi:hypothetical protein
MDVSNVIFINLILLEFAFIVSYLATHRQTIPLTATLR